MEHAQSRGFFQLGLAALTQCMAHAEGSSDLARSVSLYRNFAATSLALVRLRAQAGVKGV